MDPDETLRLIRSLCYKWFKQSLTHDQVVDLTESLADAVSDLDEWISGGGFLPADWDPDPDQVAPVQSTESVSL